MPAEILIWNYHSIRHVGHAALEINSGGRRAYCSWWPSSDKREKMEKGKTGGMRLPVKALGVRDRDFDTDAAAECGANGRRRFSAFAPGPLLPGQTRDTLRPGQVLAGQNPDGTAILQQMPQHRIRLTGLQDGPGITGLDLDRMITTWQMLAINPNRQYRMISKEYNCASIAAAILVTGGAAFYSTLFTGEEPELGTFWTNPNDVRDWAYEIQMGIQMAQRLATGPVRYRFANGAPMTRTDGNQEIMDLATWKRISAVEAGFAHGFARRKEQIATIDTLLARYHNLGGWDWSNQARCNLKLRLLAAILKESSDHIANKPDSDRRDAVLQLAAQVMDRYNNVRVGYQRFEDFMALEVRIEPHVRVSQFVE